LFTANFARPERNDLETQGNGLGPLFNAVSCGTCHSQSGPGGGGDLENNVQLIGIVTVPAPRGSVEEVLKSARTVHPKLSDNAPIKIFHKFLIGAPENIAAYDAWRDGILKDFGVDSASSVKPVRKRVKNVTMEIAQRNTPALWGMGQIDRLRNEGGDALRRRLVAEETERHPWITGRAPRTPDGKDGWYGWRGQIAGLDEMILGACSNEVGLQTPGFPEPESPAALTKPVSKKSRKGIETDLTADQCLALAAFVHSLPQPVRDPSNFSESDAGERVYDRIGCSHCHAKDLGWVSGIYSDMSLHDMGNEDEDMQVTTPELKVQEFQQLGLAQAMSNSGGGYGGSPTLSFSLQSVRVAFIEPAEYEQEWKTPPLWGVSDSAPYWHDGRAETLKEAILLHGGEADRARAAYQQLDQEDQQSLLGFLQSLKAPSEGQLTAAR